MDASAVLTELVGVSTQVVEAVIVGPDGAVEAARTSGDERAAALAARGRELLGAAGAIRAEGAEVERVHVDTERGSLVAVTDGHRTAVATTVAEPTVGLVAFDLRSALARLRGEDA
jgi:predicted regulator of Ras-like GTPase activity (Roadblock/LC7/MglB family)